MPSNLAGFERRRCAGCPDLVGGHLLYRPCAVCHAPQAWGSPEGEIPSLAGQQKHMNLASPEMTSALRGMGDQEKDALADYMARLGHAP